MRYLITGGAGFIGSHLAENLLEHGHRVHVLDDLSTGSIKNIRHLLANDRFELTVGSILDYHTLERLILASDQVFHLAAAVGVKLIVEKQVRSITANVQGTEHVLMLCCYHDKKVFVASTSEVYGKLMQTDDTIERLREDGDWLLGATTHGRWAYACSKAMDEFLAFAYHKERGLPVVVARFFNTIGPRQTGEYGMVVPKLVGAALRGAPLHVHGDGEQTRCFLHVQDAVRAVVGLMERAEAEGQLFNIGGEEALTINELAERIRALTGSSSEIEHISYEEVYGADFEDIRYRVPNVDKLQRLLDFRPRYDTEAILRDIVDHERAQGPGEDAAAG